LSKQIFRPLLSLNSFLPSNAFFISLHKNLALKKTSKNLISTQICNAFVTRGVLLCGISLLKCVICARFDRAVKIFNAKSRGEKQNEKDYCYACCAVLDGSLPPFLRRRAE
jgi:hypothetical protein